MSVLPISPDQPLEFRKKDGSLSKMRNHKGNIPVLPQNKLCPHCPAKFTRTTHLNRHLRTHTNERLHRCDTCDSQFTRSDLLTRHKKSCNDPSSRTRRKSCASCTESKIKCDRQYPCSKCASRGRECVFSGSGRKTSASNQPQQSLPTCNEAPSEASTNPSTLFVPTPEAMHSYSGSFHVQESEEIGSSNISMPSIQESKSFPSHHDSPVVDRYPPTSDVDRTHDSEHLLPVHSHLSSIYASDMFEPFFSNIFSQPPPSAPITDFSWPESLGHRTNSPEEFPFATLTTSASGYHEAGIGPEVLSGPSSFHASPMLQPATSDVRHNPAIDSTSTADPAAPELQHYLYLFFSAFLSQVPIVHAKTFNPENKPQILLSAMQACGALFVKTRKATIFITKTLASARETLVQEFATHPTDSAEQIHLILAVVLLQTIGLFHQQPDQRASSSIYHGMLVMMIRRTGIMTKNAAWEPGSLTNGSLETLWQEWVSNETTKRAIWWSYLHDCCHSIYFALPSSYHPSEIELNLPCEDGLWQAGSSEDWFRVLQTTSPYGSSKSRLIGISMPQSLVSLSVPMNPFSHFILIHSILRHLFVTCVERRISETVRQEIYNLQYALHSWLQNWMNSPELPQVNGSNDEPAFVHNGTLTIACMYDFDVCLHCQRFRFTGLVK